MGFVRRFGKSKIIRKVMGWLRSVPPVSRKTGARNRSFHPDSFKGELLAISGFLLILLTPQFNPMVLPAPGLRRPVKPMASGALSVFWPSALGSYSFPTEKLQV